MQVDHDSVQNSADVREKIGVAQDIDGYVRVKEESLAVDGRWAGTCRARNYVERVPGTRLEKPILSPGGNKREPLSWGAKVQPQVGVLEGAVPAGAGILAKEGRAATVGTGDQLGEELTGRGRREALQARDWVTHPWMCAPIVGEAAVYGLHGGTVGHSPVERLAGPCQYHLHGLPTNVQGGTSVLEAGDSVTHRRER